MFQSKITISATGNTEDEVVEAILFQMNQIIREEGKNITVETIKETDSNRNQHEQ